MATYPDDATISQESFSVVSEIKYTNTGSDTEFTLDSSATFTGEVIAIADGITQATDSYSITSSGDSITFTTAPNASNLTLKVVSVPARFRINRTIDDARAVDYSNTSATVVDSNTFLINGNTESFALPAGSNASTVNELFVYVSGVYQDGTAYTYPSVVYGVDGIDIGDNTATKLLLNFNGSDAATSTTDASPSSHTISFEGNAQLDTAAKQFGTASLLLDGTNDAVNIAASNDFDFSDDNYTLECFVRPATGAFSANTTVLSRTKDASNFYRLDLLPNANFSFSYMNAGTNHIVTGGNANGGIFYHVAVSYNHADSNLALYVNNVRVQTNAFSVSNHAVMVDAPLQIGNANLLAQDFSGHVDALRASKSLKYKTAGIVAMNTEPTVIGGGALGSLQSTDKLTIRTFGMSVVTNDRFNSMADRKPDTGFQTQEKFESSIFTSQAGYEKRRLKSRRSKRNYTLTYSNISGIERTAIEEFYRARSGDFESFTFDLSHLNDSGTLNTRFDGPLDIQQVLSSGSSLTENFYTVSFKLQEVYD
tara:strand:- start:35173 stop:36789 length:1617 start_codon:yes stop_codon:yes gene_type:complete